MTLRQMLLGGGRFAHFAGGAAAPAAPPAPAAAKTEEGGEDEEAKRAAAAKAEEDEAARKAEDEAAAKRAKRKSRAKKRDDDGDDDDDAADDDEREDDEEDMKKAAAAGYEFALEAAFRAGARAQRGRCSAIFAHKAAAANPVLSMSLAFETSMTSAAAIAVLEKTPAPRGNALATRMAETGAANVRVAPSMPEAPKGPAAIAQSWDVALAGFRPAK